jgi:hypothetical protein
MGRASIVGVTVSDTDRRGAARPSRIDIGAFQDRGFAPTIVGVSSPWGATIGIPVASPLSVTTTGPNRDPFAGRVITISAPSRRASARLDRPRAVVGADGRAGVAFAASDTIGSRPVTASARSVATRVTFAPGHPGPAAGAAVLGAGGVIRTVALPTTGDGMGPIPANDNGRHPVGAAGVRQVLWPIDMRSLGRRMPSQRALRPRLGGLRPETVL